MTDHESDDIRALFHSADLDQVPASRDLIGPAVAWGSGRRRRDRWTAAGLTGAVAAVAVAGAVALRPGGEGTAQAVAPGRAAPARTSAEPATSPTAIPALPKLSGTIPQQEQKLLDALKPYLPAGVRIACQHLGGAQDGFCTPMTVTGPTGTSIAQWMPGKYDYQAAPVDAKYVHPHKATPAIPLVSGTIEVPGGSVRVISSDTEAQDNVDDKTTLTDPTALAFHTAVYEFIPAGPGMAVSMQLCELVRDMPWKPGAGQAANDHAVWGFNQTGPVLSPQQFASLATAPIFPSVMQRLADLQGQASRQHQPASTSSH
jgi:hypothetical protein